MSRSNQQLKIELARKEKLIAEMEKQIKRMMSFWSK